MRRILFNDKSKKNKRDNMHIFIPLTRLEEIYNTYKKNKKTSTEIKSILNLTANSGIEALLSRIKTTLILANMKTADNSSEVTDFIIDTENPDDYFKKQSSSDPAVNTLVFELLCGGNKIIQKYFKDSGKSDAKEVWRLIKPSTSNHIAYIKSNFTYQELYWIGFFDELDESVNTTKIITETIEKMRQKAIYLTNVRLAAHYILEDDDNNSIFNIDILLAKLLVTLALAPSPHEHEQLYKKLKAITRKPLTKEEKKAIFATIEATTKLPFVTISATHVRQLDNQQLDVRAKLFAKNVAGPSQVELAQELHSLAWRKARLYPNEQKKLILRRTIVTRCLAILQNPNTDNPNINLFFLAYALLSDNGRTENIAQKLNISIPAYSEENLRAIFSINNIKLRTIFLACLENLRVMNHWNSHIVSGEILNKPSHQINTACLERLQPNNNDNTAHIIMILLATINGLKKIQKLNLEKAKPFLEILIAKNPLLNPKKKLQDLVSNLDHEQPEAEVFETVTIEHEGTSEQTALINYDFSPMELDSIFNETDNSLAIADNVFAKENQNAQEQDINQKFIARLAAHYPGNIPVKYLTFLLQLSEHDATFIATSLIDIITTTNQLFGKKMLSGLRSGAKKIAMVKTLTDFICSEENGEPVAKSERIAKILKNIPQSTSVDHIDGQALIKEAKNCSSTFSENTSEIEIAAVSEMLLNEVIAEAPFKIEIQQALTECTASQFKAPKDDIDSNSYDMNTSYCL